MMSNILKVKVMRVCFFGSYENGSLPSRIKTLLENEGVEVIECQEDVKNIFQLILSYPKLLFKHRKLDYDVMIVPWRGIMTLPLARVIKKGPIMYFAYVSLYDSFVCDRQYFSENSIQAKFIRFCDKRACKLSDITILENFETINWFCKEYKLKKENFRKLIWGADDDKFKPLTIKKREKIFLVSFLGSFIPFHGVDTIVECAEILKNHDDIKFVIMGKGQTWKENYDKAIKKGLKNIEFTGFIPFKKVLEHLNNSDVTLGVFGDYERRTNVVANKVLQMLLCQKPLITRDTPVMHEIGMKDEENCLLIPCNDPAALSDAILKLKNSQTLSENIGRNSYTFAKQITEESWKFFWEHDLKHLLKK